MSVGQILGGAVGAVIGFYVGGPAGAFQGFAIGSAIGAIVLPGAGTSTRGPQLSDLNNQISSYGATIPILKGKFRIPGNIIWATKKQPIDHTTSSGGKGGPSNETTTTKYISSFAIAFCEGPCDAMGTVWIDKKAAIDLRDVATAQSIIASGFLAKSIRFYPGTEEQMPDPLIESYEGVGNTSAFRGTCYVVFEDFELTPYGNRIPMIEVEIFANASKATTRTNICELGPDDLGDPNIRGYSWITNQAIYLWRKMSGYDYAHIALYVSVDGAEKELVAPSIFVPEANAWDVIPVNTQTQFLVETVEVTPIVGTQNAFQKLWIFSLIAGVQEDRKFLDLGVVSDSYTVGGGVYRMAAYDESTDVIAYGIRDPNARYFGERVTIAKSGSSVTDASGGISQTGGQPIGSYVFRGEQVGSGTVLSALACSLGRVYAMIYNSGDGKMHLHVLSQDDASLIDDFVGPTVPPDYGSDILESIRVDGSTVYAFVGTSLAFKWNADGSFKILATDAHVTFDGGGRVDPLGGPMVYIDDSIMIQQGEIGLGTIGGYPIFRHQLIRWDVPSPTSITLADVVQEIADIARVPVDVSELTDPLTGFVVTRQMSAADVLNYLAAIYHFDGQPDGGSLKFKKRGGPAVMTIDVDDLGAHDFSSEAPDAVPIGRKKELDLAQNITVNYTDAGNDYLTGSTPSLRLNTAADSRVTLDATAVTLTGDEAAKLADISKQIVLVERQTFAFSGDYRLKRLQPADVVIIDAHDVSFRVRLKKVTDQAGLIQCEAVADDALIYDSAAVGTGKQSTASVVTTKASSRLELMDIPILRNEDDNEGFYAKAAPRNPGTWAGASIYQIDGGAEFPLGTVTRKGVVGIALNALPAYAGPRVFDESSFVDVQVPSDMTLSSVTRVQALAGANAFLVGAEIIVARSAVTQGAGKYRLSGLRRYLRGTEYASHQVGERVVLLETNGTIRVVNGVGSAHGYQAVTLGSKIIPSLTQRFTNTARGLATFPPVQLGYGEDGSGGLLFTWRRCTRLITEFGAEAPLGEDEEHYQIDFGATPDFTVGRTFYSDQPSLSINALERLLIPQPFFWRVRLVASGRGSADPVTTPTTVLAPTTAPPNNLSNLLLDIDARNAADGAPIVDSSPHATPVTVQGNAAIAGKHIVLSGGYLEIEGSIFDFGDKDFSFEWTMSFRNLPPTNAYGAQPFVYVFERGSRVGSGGGWRPGALLCWADLGRGQVGPVGVLKAYYGDNAAANKGLGMTPNGQNNGKERTYRLARTGDDFYFLIDGVVIDHYQDFGLTMGPLVPNEPLLFGGGGDDTLRGKIARITLRTS